jgi:hypothetical protein
LAIATVRSASSQAGLITGPAHNRGMSVWMISRIGVPALLALAVLGVFGTWRTAASVSLNGLEGPHDGWLVILFALFALAGLRSLARGGRLGGVLVFGCAAAMVYFTVRNLLDDRDVLGGSSGWGIWLTFAAGVLVAGVSLGVVVRGSTRGYSRASRASST